MTRLQFLLYSIKHKAYFQPSWIIAAFSYTRETEESRKASYPGKIIREDFGIFFINDAGEQEKIDDAPTDKKPLFHHREPITITPEWISSLKQPSLETTIGRLLINLCMPHYAFGDRFPYRNDKLSFKEMEKFILPRMESVLPDMTERDPAKFYTDEYLKFHTGADYLTDFAQLFSHSITEVGLFPPPKREEYRQTLLKEYEGKLSNPVMMAEFVKKMEAFDGEYLKSDPSDGKFMSGKVRAARTKAFLTYGGETNGFSSSLELTPIVEPLEKGTPTDPISMAAMVNNSRSSSFARGAETMNGGVVAKRIGQATDSWRIVDEDCGTKLSLDYIVTEDEVEFFVGQYIFQDGKTVKIETIEMARTFINRKVSARSPQYCRSEGPQTCRFCAGEALAKHPNGLSIPGMEVSAGFTTDALKKMHNMSIKTNVVDWRTVIS